MSESFWVNVLSADGSNVAAKDLESIAARANAAPVLPVGVMPSRKIVPVGYASRFEVRDAEDLWAYVELEPDEPLPPFERAFGIVAQIAGAPCLVAVVLTSLSRDEIRSLMGDELVQPPRDRKGS